MARHVYAAVPVIFFAFFSALAAPGVSGRALAGNECLEQPSWEPEQTGHWYYRSDREKNRKCWHLEAPKVPESVLPREQMDAVVRGTPVRSVFSSLFGGRPTAPLESMPQDTAVGEPRIIQSDPTRILTIEDIAQPQPDLPEEHAEPRYVTPLTASQRRALFEEYLKWEELQRNLGNAGAPARSP